MSQPELTVIIPIRNEQDHIGSLLDDLVRQTLDHSRFEIIIVDGMSEDNTLQVVENYMTHLPNIRIETNPKHRSGPARNIGANAAIGKWLLFVDGHCQIPSENMLKSVWETFSSGAKCISRPQPLLNTEQGHITAIARSSLLGHHKDSMIYSFENTECDPSSAGCGYEKELYASLGGIDERFDAAEDLEFNIRVSDKGIKAHHHRDFALEYVPRESLKSLFRQLYRYGLGRALITRKNPKHFSLLSFLLALFSISIVVLPFINLTVWGFITGCWILACGIDAIIAAKSKKWLSVMITLMIIHLAAGIGYISGLVGGPGWSHSPAKAS
ncbi:MAG: glycosyltransferase [bacterium]|nr:glycosyltransferase [bacterium]